MSRMFTVFSGLGRGVLGVCLGGACSEWFKVLLLFYLLLGVASFVLKFTLQRRSGPGVLFGGLVSATGLYSKGITMGVPRNLGGDDGLL